MDPVNSGLVLEHMPVKRKLKLQEKLDQVYRETGKPFQGDLWKLSDHIPTWMNVLVLMNLSDTLNIDYFEWHRDQRAKFSLDAWESADRPRVLVMQCLRQSDEKCGGTADRLKPFLFILREAAITKRLLFIHWTLPAPLEEFLLPPEHGIDWRAPAWFAPIIEDEVSSPGWKVARFKVFKKAVRGDSPFLRSRIQSIYGGAEEYDQELLPGESTFDQVYHDVWRVLFTPSPPIREIIEGYMNEWHLTPGNYAAAHLRALYARIQNRTDEEATLLTQNSLNCASKLRPGGPFFFSSDHSPSIQFALDYGKRMNVQVFARPQDFNQLPLHLDKASDILNRKPQEFYDTFVDLYLMGMSRCLTYNRGGFGTWALLLGYNSSCVHNQKTTAVRINAPCNWTTPTTSATTITQKGSELHPMPPLFIDTMPSKD
eukprot:Nitzschia sp. Nitz4//scaffold113_size70149//10443//11767//NITZ4_005940-RA/size70149-snap-gene-0.134-mRNA-1//1//CDS//3329533311//3292//frame0